MPRRATEPGRFAWEPLADPDGLYSSGIADLDRLMAGGFRRGSFALFNTDETLLPNDHTLLLGPAMLNFLYQSRGMIAVLPARDTPRGFRAEMLRWVSRRLFDSRVRVVDYAGEEEAPYVVSLAGTMGRRGRTEKARAEAMAKMEAAEKAVQGRRGRPFLEFNAFEVIDTVAGSELAARMFFHGIKRTRAVGNLGIGLMRPGLGCAAALRSLVDYEFRLHRTSVGLHLTGDRPTFPTRLVVEDRRKGPPYLELVPPP